MKNFAEQQMGAVLNPYANHPEMNRAVVTASAEMPRDIRDTAKAIAEQPWLTRGERDRMARQIEQAILAERQRDQWQPISTAPKDWTGVILFDPNEDDNGGVSQGYYSMADGGHGKWISHYFRSCSPTHWMPIPVPPKGGAA